MGVWFGRWSQTTEWKRYRSVIHTASGKNSGETEKGKGNGSLVG